eukprot:342275_1
MAIHKDPKEFFNTAKVIVQSSEEKSNQYHDINQILQQLTDFYKTLMQQQMYHTPFMNQFHFFGIRDFYHLIAYLKVCINNVKMDTLDLIISAVSRNFGGLNKQQFKTFLLPIMCNVFEIETSTAMMNKIWTLYSSINLIKDNILETQQTEMNSDYDPRHILLIADSETTWKLYLYDMNILQHDTSCVIFGNHFKNEKNSSLNFYQNIEKIKNAMSNGHTVVLLHLNNLYDCLYHVLNQRYLKIGSKQFSSISISDETIRVQIHPSFRFIIVAPISSAHHTSENVNDHTPIAFLNRLEKHYIPINNLYDHHQQLLSTLEKKLKLMYAGLSYFHVFAGYVPTLTAASALVYAQHAVSKKATLFNQLDEEKDDDAKVIDFAIAILSSNCHAQQFWSKDDNTTAFKSLIEIIKYFSSKVLEPIQLIRVTTYEHLTEQNDLKKYFIVKDVFEEWSDSTDSKLKKIVLVNINNIESSTEFETILNVFLLDRNSITLVIQCSNNNKDQFLHNLHVQYLIEKAKDVQFKNRHNSTVSTLPLSSKQIIVVLYMNRIDYSVNIENKLTVEHIQSQQFPLVFNLEWIHIHCDAILPTEIDISHLLQPSFTFTNLCEYAVMKALKTDSFITAKSRRLFLEEARGLLQGKHDGLKEVIVSKVINAFTNTKLQEITLEIKEINKKLNNVAKVSHMLPVRGSFRDFLSQQGNEAMQPM